MSKRKSPKLKIEKEGSVTSVSFGDHVVKIYEESPVKHRVTWYVGTQRIRRAYTSGEAALEAAEDVLNQLKEGRGELTQTPAQKIEHFILLEKAVYPATMDEVVRYYLDKRPRQIPRKLLKEVADEMVEAREAAQKRKGGSTRWVEALNNRLKKLTNRFSCPIGNITVAEMEAFLLDPKHGWSERTRFNIQQTAALLFNFARRKGYLEPGETIIDKMDRVEKPTPDPKVFRTDALARLLKAAREQNPKLVPYIAIGAFAGLRSIEISRLNWEDHVDFEEGVIRLPSEITKTGRRRTVQMHKTLLEWLLPFKGSTGKVVPYRRIHKFLGSVAKAAKVRWLQNGLRHSCISYGMVIEPNAHLWAEQSGHSVAVLQTNYKQLVAKKDAEVWFALTPLCLDKLIKRASETQVLASMAA